MKGIIFSCDDRDGGVFCACASRSSDVVSFLLMTYSTQIFPITNIIELSRENV
ncbi:hypothetical protein [Simkania negevensis]|uniref:Uncharacterized protein n=1 Tax=Simkania negevensis (strain ATCC VR-1471 / DSM 27360 / Z) TaxID=331113 RepID=F8L5D8_SIMNZ|nr:hypothetical protein [Simkania negevensis]CCB88032.1 unknown protein [Simkania negevensis Z]